MPESSEPRARTVAEKIAELRVRRTRYEEGGGAARIEREHKAGKLSARERIAALVDTDSFQEGYLFAKHRCTAFGMAGKEMPADGVVTGAGTVDGRLIYLASQDFTVGGGAAGEVHCDKIAEMMAASLKTGSPFIFINDSGGARVQEGIDSLAGYGRVFYHNVLLSGRRTTDLTYLRSLCRRSGVQPGADRLHHPDSSSPNVHYRAVRHQAGDGRRRLGPKRWAGPKRR